MVTKISTKKRMLSRIYASSESGSIRRRFSSAKESTKVKKSMQQLEGFPRRWNSGQTHGSATSENSSSPQSDSPSSISPPGTQSRQNRFPNFTTSKQCVLIVLQISSVPPNAPEHNKTNRPKHTCAALNSNHRICNLQNKLNWHST